MITVAFFTSTEHASASDPKRVCNPRAVNEPYRVDDPPAAKEMVVASVPRKYDSQTIELSNPVQIPTLQDLRGNYFRDKEAVLILGMFLKSNEQSACNRTWASLVKPKLEGAANMRRASYRGVEVVFDEHALIRRNRIQTSDDGQLIVFPALLFSTRLQETTRIYDHIYKNARTNEQRLAVLSSYLVLGMRHVRIRDHPDNQNAGSISALEVDKLVNETFGVDCSAQPKTVCLLHRAMTVNESPPDSAFRLSDALFNNSALSFGVSQFDLGARDAEGERAIAALFGTVENPAIPADDYRRVRQPVRLLTPQQMHSLYMISVPKLSQKLRAPGAERVVLKGYIDYLTSGTNLAIKKSTQLPREAAESTRLIVGVITADLLNQGNFDGVTLRNALLSSNDHCDFIGKLRTFLAPRAERAKVVVDAFNRLSVVKVPECKHIFAQWQ